MLEITNLTRKYISRVAVDNLSLTIEPGRTYVLLGPNGSGKTTLMKMIAGLTKPTTGDIRFNGEAVGPRTKAAIAYMPTESYFYNYMTIRDAGRYYADFFADFSMARYEESLHRMELNPKDKINTLSSGMNAKVRLALTLAREGSLTDLYLRIYGGVEGDDPVMQAVAARLSQRMREEAEQRRAEQGAKEAAPAREEVPEDA